MTKKIAAILLSINCFLLANGQIKKGAVLLGGQISYSNSTIDYMGTQRSSNFKRGIYNVSLGKSYKENTVYGFNASYSPFSYSNYNYGSEYANLKSHQISLGLYFRNYKPLAKDLYFFTEAGITYTNDNQETTDSSGVSSGTIKLNGGELYLTPGISYRIFNNLHLEIIIPKILSIQYSNTSTFTNLVNYSSDNFSFNTSLNSNGLSNLGVGFHFIF